MQPLDLDHGQACRTTIRERLRWRRWPAYCGIRTIANVCAGPIGFTVSPVFQPSVARYEPGSTTGPCGTPPRPPNPPPAWPPRPPFPAFFRTRHSRWRGRRRISTQIPSHPMYAGCLGNAVAGIAAIELPDRAAAGVGDGQHQPGISRLRLCDVVGDHSAVRGIRRRPVAFDDLLLPQDVIERRVAQGKHARLLGQGLRAHLAQRAVVVEHVEAAAEGAQHEIGLGTLHGQVAHLHRREPAP